MDFLFPATDSKSQLKRGLRVTPYSLRVSSNLPPACVSPPFSGVSCSFPGLWAVSAATRVQLAAPAGV